MEAIRKFVDVEDNSFKITLPEGFKAKRVEVIILPSEEYKLSEETRLLLEERLEYYKKNTDDLIDFDLLLGEIERDL